MLFLDYLQIYIDRYDKVRDPKTIQKYVTARNKLAEYEKQCRKKLKFKDINIDFTMTFNRGSIPCNMLITTLEAS